MNQPLRSKTFGSVSLLLMLVASCAPTAGGAAASPTVEAKNAPAQPPTEPEATSDAGPETPAHIVAGDLAMQELPQPSPQAATMAPRLRCEKRESGWGCVAPDGTVTIPFEHLELGPFSKAGIAPAFHPEKGLWYVDATGKYLYEAFNFDNGFDPLTDERSRFVFRGKVGFLDREHRVVIPPRYDAARAFTDGNALVCVGCDPRIWSKDAPSGLAEGQRLFVDHQGQEFDEKPAAIPTPPTCSEAVVLEPGRKTHFWKDQSEATKATGQLDITEAGLFSGGGRPASFSTCAEIEAITGQGPYIVKLGRGSGPEGPVAPTAFRLTLPDGVPPPLEVGQPILFERIVRPSHPGVLLSYRVSDNGHLLLATRTAGGLVTRGPVVEREAGRGAGYASQLTHRVDVTIEGRTAHLAPGQWRKLETESGTWLLQGRGSSWGPGRRPADAHGSLALSIVRLVE